MYKKIILSFLLILSVLVTFFGCSILNYDDKSNEEEYVKAVWITYYELSEFTMDSDESTFKKAISQAFKELEINGFNRVTVQIRPYADAFYRSSYFPTSAYCFGEQGSELIYDPLEIMISAAHKYNLFFEAWINPYRISTTNDFTNLSNSSKALEWKDTDNLIVCDSGIYFNPASAEAEELIINGVKEIAENYQVDGICFDDYFYPSSDNNIDKSSYDAYVKNNGELSLDDFRRDNVSRLIKSVYSAVKSINENITFGVSPASDIENDYSALYADVELWATNEGYVDYLCPQIYFGFLNENQPFMKTAKLWESTADCKLYIGLPLYKSGQQDEFAGDSGTNEFVENNNIIARQITYISKLEKIGGFYLFSYSSLKDNDECNNLYSAMQTSLS